MSWISGNCQGDRRFECYYAGFNPDNFNETFCRDSDEPCQGIIDAFGLIRVVDHNQPSGGGW